MSEKIISFGGIPREDEDEQTFWNAADPMAAVLVRSEKELRDAVRAKMSPAGALGLPELLDKRRIEHELPDSFWKFQPTFSSVHIYQPETPEMTPGGIVLTDTTRDREQRSQPEGLLLAAGLKALDALRSHGVDLGHWITFVNLAPWAIVVDNIGGHDYYLRVLNAGDIRGSKDTAELLRSRELKIECVEGIHRYTGWQPVNAKPSMEYR
jgi:hypothetical protein